MILDQMHNRMETSMYGAVFNAAAKIHPPRTFLIFGYMERMADQLVNALVVDCGDRDYGDA